MNWSGHSSLRGQGIPRGHDGGRLLEEVLVDVLENRLPALSDIGGVNDVSVRYKVAPKKVDTRCGVSFAPGQRVVVVGHSPGYQLRVRPTRLETDKGERSV